MNITERIIYIGIIFLLGFFLIKSLNNTRIIINEIPGDTKVDTVKIKYDSLIPTYIDTGFYKVDTMWLHDTLFLPTDTAAILADYFKMISYDSIILRNDSSITNWVDLKITQNRLYEISGYSLNNRKQVVIKEDYNNFGIGGLVGGDLFAPTISYQWNSHNIGLGYNVVGSNGIILKYEYKIKKR